MLITLNYEKSPFISIKNDTVGVSYLNHSKACMMACPFRLLFPTSLASFGISKMPSRASFQVTVILKLSHLPQQRIWGSMLPFAGRCVEVLAEKREEIRRELFNIITSSEGYGTITTGMVKVTKSQLFLLVKVTKSPQLFQLVKVIKSQLFPLYWIWTNFVRILFLISC